MVKMTSQVTLTLTAQLWAVMVNVTVCMHQPTDSTVIKNQPKNCELSYYYSVNYRYCTIMSLLYEILWESSSSSEDNDNNDEPHSRSRKRKVFRPRIDRFQKWDDNEFLDRFRVSKALVRALANHLGPQLQTRTMRNNAITPEQQILMALEFYACGSFQRCIGDAAGVHKSSVCRTIHRVSRAIAGLRSEWISMPNNRQAMEKETRQFYEISAFPKTVGAIDCTHIPIKSPGGIDAEIYRNRKQFFSLNVQVVCNASMYINNIVARWPGSCHDSHIFNSSVIKGRLEDGEFQDFWVLGDKGYGVKPYLLTPLRNPITEAERLYNESHIRTRNVIERTFGCWKKRFPSLSWKLRTDPIKAQAAIVAMAVLHNICRRSRDPMPYSQYDDENVADEEESYIITSGHNDEHNRNMLINNYFSRLAHI